MTRYDLNMTICDKFEADVQNGQLCYSLNMSKLGGEPTLAGKENGLFLVIDPNNIGISDKSLNGQTKEDGFRIHIDTLYQQTLYGPGCLCNEFVENDDRNKQVQETCR